MSATLRKASRSIRRANRKRISHEEKEMAVNKEDYGKALLDVYFALKVGSTLTNDEAWVL